MTISNGQNIPAISIKKMGDNGIEDVILADYIANKKVVLFAVPGAFTPSCHLKHLPGYIANAEAIKSSGIDEIICLSVNDPFVMKAWGESAGAAGKITMVSDWKAELVNAMGLSFDASGAGLGIRAQRFSMIVKHGTVEDLQVEAVASAVELSGADVCLRRLAA